MSSVKTATETLSWTQFLQIKAVRLILFHLVIQLSNLGMYQKYRRYLFENNPKCIIGFLLMSEQLIPNICLEVSELFRRLNMNGDVFLDASPNEVFFRTTFEVLCAEFNKKDYKPETILDSYHLFAVFCPTEALFSNPCTNCQSCRFLRTFCVKCGTSFKSMQLFLPQLPTNNQSVTGMGQKGMV